MKSCPRCDAEIGDTAVACSCGWRDRKAKDAPIEPPGPCGYEGCHLPAMCKLRTPTGWLNVCDNHYRIYFHSRAEKTCRDLGLTTIEQKRAWLRNAVSKLANKMRPNYMREPGQDDEEAA